MERRPLETTGQTVAPGSPQTDLSRALSAQALDALWALLRGLESSDNGTLQRITPAALTGGLLSVLMRLVFMQFAQGRGMIAEGKPLYSLSLALRGCVDSEPCAENPRSAAWGILLEGLKRHSPRKALDASSFIEAAPTLSDSCLREVLQHLMVVDGEPVDYASLDIEVLGAIYESLIGASVARAITPSIAVRPRDVAFSLEELLDQPPGRRARWLKASTDCSLSTPAAAALKAATTAADVLVALERRRSSRTPAALPEGAYFIQHGTARRRSGSHYTPRALTTSVVRTALRPLLERMGAQPTPAQILDLKVCDPAMGSGAFLLEACRQLSDALLSAWSEHGEMPSEMPLRVARRLVSQQCLYGVDKNWLAIQLAQCSLWLLSADCTLPLSFLDHTLRCGDALVGARRAEIAAFQWTLDDEQGTPASSEADHAADQPEGAGLKGDLLVSSFFAAGTARTREASRKARLGWWQAAVAGSAPALARVQGAVAALPVTPMHWEVVFPEVFDRSRSGFDCLIGNPPFLGGTMISTAFGSVYRDFILQQFTGIAGRSDLVAYFFRRAQQLLNAGGCCGFIATNSIAQGNTRRGGLAAVIRAGATIYAARVGLRWPGVAAVTVSVVHLCNGDPGRTPMRNGVSCAGINSFLLPSKRHVEPAPLDLRLDFFMGSKIYGQGFVFDDRDAKANPISLLEIVRSTAPGSARLVRPYVGGAEINNPPRNRQKWVIDFGEMSEAEARQHPLLWQITQARVAPGRQTAPKQVRELPSWWFFNRRTPQYQRARMRSRVLVRSAVSQHHAFRWWSPHSVFSHNVFILNEDAAAALTVLHSRTHEAWVNLTSSSLEDRQGYRPSDCLITFPWPTDWKTSPALNQIGMRYQQWRHQLMTEQRLGLTQIYNRFHAPECTLPGIVRLRVLHGELDRAVLDAFGWQDITPICDFRLDQPIDEETWSPRKKKPYRYRWSNDVRDTVLARLLDLNQRYAAAEMATSAEKKG